MKKKQKINKLQLSRETLRELTATENRRAAGGVSDEVGSCQSNMRCVCITGGNESADEACGTA